MNAPRVNSAMVASRRTVTATVVSEIAEGRTLPQVREIERAALLLGIVADAQSDSLAVQVASLYELRCEASRSAGSSDWKTVTP